jgi:hypothetical protein
MGCSIRLGLRHGSTVGRYVPRDRTISPCVVPTAVSCFRQGLPCVGSNRSFALLAVACFPSRPLPLVLPLFHANIAITCKPIANTRLGLATSSMNKAAAILSNVTLSMEYPRETSAHTRAHGNGMSKKLLTDDVL